MNTRDIIFRGKRDNGEWVEGYYGVFKDTHQIYTPFTEEEEKENEGHFLSAIGGLWHTVIPETIGQYTGLTDKNGKKIFEGDIIFRPRKYRTDREEIYKVIYSESAFQYSALDGKFYYSFDDYEFGISTEFYEIIGNIHDNPELLEG